MDAKAWDERYAAHEHVWGAEPNQFVRRMCESLPLGHALDLACGEGRNTLWLARLGWRAHGVDYSGVAIDRARRLAAAEPGQVQARATFAVGDVAADDFVAAPADLVLISYVHLPHDQHLRLLHTAAAAVRPEGHLVVVGHDRRNLDEGVGGPQDASLLYVPGDVAEVLRGDGLEIETASTVDRVTAEGIALDTLVRARRPSHSGAR